MSTETIGEGLTTAQVEEMTASGGWTRIVMSPEKQAQAAADFAAHDAAMRREAMKNRWVRFFHWCAQSQWWKDHVAERDA